MDERMPSAASGKKTFAMRIVRAALEIPRKVLAEAVAPIIFESLKQAWPFIVALVLTALTYFASNAAMLSANLISRLLAMVLAIIVAVLSVLLISFQRKIRRLSSSPHKNEAAVAQDVRSSPPQSTQSNLNKCFTAFASQNAECDRQIFDLLGVIFLERIGPHVAPTRATFDSKLSSKQGRQEVLDLLERVGIQESARHSALLNVRPHIVTNIRDAVDMTRSVTNAYLGIDRFHENACAACLKIPVKPAVEAPIGKFMVATPYRDTLSFPARRNGNMPFAIDDNTLTIEVLAQSADKWGHDNLTSLGSIYKNPRKVRTYNATLGIGIADLVPGEFRNKAVLCVDNKLGGLANDNVAGLMREIGLRVGVMLYRLAAIEKALEKIGAA